MIHTVKGFSIVNEAEVGFFFFFPLEFPCFFYDLMDVGSLISGSSAFSKSNLYIWKFLVHLLLKPESESEVAKLCPTLRNPMDCSLPGSSVHGISQARVLECVAIAFPESSS